MRSGPVCRETAPLVPLAFGLVAGLLLARLAPAAGALLAAPLLVVSVAPRWRPYALGVLLGLLIAPLAVAHGRGRGFAEALDLPAVHELEGVVRTASPPGPAGSRVVLDVGEVGGVTVESLGIRLGVGAGPGRVPRPGERVRVAARLSPPRAVRNPGAIDMGERDRRGGIHLRGWVDEPTAFAVVARGRGFASWVGGLRVDAAAQLDDRLATADAGLARALVVGDRGGLAAGDHRRFRRTGQAHLIAVSGLHVGLLLAGLLLTLRWLGFGPRLCAGVGLAAVVFYVPFAGARPPVVRAGSAAALWFGGALLGRPVSTGGVLATVVVAVLVLEPGRLADVALVLSLAAVLSILLLHERIATLLIRPRPVVPGILPPRRTPVRRALAVSIAAWLGTAPLLAAYVGHLCPLAPFVAVPAVALTALLVAAAFLLLVPVDVVIVSDIAAWVFHFVASLLRGLLDTVLAPGLGALPVTAPSAGWCVLYVTAILGAGLAGTRAARMSLLGAACLLAVLFWPPHAPRPAHPEVWILDVGHGQAAVVLFPDGRAALLDAGRMGDPDVGRRVILPALRALGVRRLALACASHGDADHAGGLPDVHAVVPIDRLHVPPDLGRSKRRDLEQAGLTLRDTRRGDVLLRGAWGVLTTLGPPETPRGPRSANDASLVLRIETASGVRMLFPGDLAVAGVADLLADPVGVSAEVMLLPHHGLPGAGRERLLDAVAPAHRLASCGRSVLRHLPPNTVATADVGALRIELGPDKARVHTPFTVRGDGYDPAPVMSPLGSLNPDALLLAVIAALAAFAFVATRLLRWLTPAGAAAAFGLGTTSYVAFGATGLGALLAPFAVANLLGKLPGGDGSGARTFRQVAANGVPALLGAGLALAGLETLGWSVFLGALACLGADTCATEIGTRYGGEPRSLMGRQPMARGESGGVTNLGLLASVGGAALTPFVAWAAGALDATGLGWVTLAGTAAALLDSLLGQHLQYRGRDASTNAGRVTEARATSSGPTEHVSGLRWLDNDAVNLVAGLAGALIAVALLA